MLEIRPESAGAPKNDEWNMPELHGYDAVKKSTWIQERSTPAAVPQNLPAELLILKADRGRRRGLSLPRQFPDRGLAIANHGSFIG